MNPFAFLFDRPTCPDREAGCEQSLPTGSFGRTERADTSRQRRAPMPQVPGPVWAGALDIDNRWAEWRSQLEQWSFDNLGRRPPPPPEQPPGVIGVTFCEALQPPPFWSVAPYTRECIQKRWGTLGWPDVACTPPCVLPRTCDLPTEDEREAARSRFQPLTVFQAPGLPWIWQPYEQGEAVDEEQLDLVLSALALLVRDAELVRWAVCLAARWARTGAETFWRWPDPPPFGIDPALGGTSYSTPPGEIASCIHNALAGQLTVLLVKAFYTLDNTGVLRVGGATGGATDAIPMQNPGQAILFDPHATWQGRRGAVHPVLHPHWLSAVDANREPVADPPRALCAIVAVAGVIIHEWLHLCAAGHAQDDFDCHAIQNQSAMIFTWAMGQRYPCLQDVPLCCPKVGDFYFASSEPAPNLGLGIQGEPFPWEPGPCR